MAVAFFDLDKTLIYRNSGTIWLKRELSAGHISYWQATQAFGWLFRYSLGFANIENGIRAAIRTLSGMQERDINQRIAAFYKTDVQSLYRPGGRVALEKHRSRGDRLVLLSSASIYLGRQVQAALSLDDALCIEFVVGPDGKYTGEPKTPMCFGHGKLEMGLNYLNRHGERLDEATFYTDSMSDLPMMEAVGHPVAVNPDPRLRRTAKGRGWPIVDWG
ncbi:MAG: HAD family phosphatase, partial [Myxococcota bacterium]